MGSAALLLGEPIHRQDVIGGVLLPLMIKSGPRTENRAEPPVAAPIGSSA